MASYTVSELNRLSDVLYKSQAELIVNGISLSPTTYALTAGISTELSSAYSQYDTALQAVLLAELNYKAAVQAKDLKRKALADKFSDYLPICYATQTVTNDELAQLGLKPRVPRSGTLPPQIPMDLVASIITGGVVQLKWKRNGNTSTTTFVVQKKVEDGAWENAWIGSRSKVELTGYAPGVMVTFRVYAVKADEQSVPSNVAVIYDDGGAGELPIAA